MADFVAVLKKTIDAQADKSPELRQRVYAKARATIEQKLVTANASQAVAIRQRNLLEDAIAAVEASYAPPAQEAEEPLDDALEDFLQEANQSFASQAPARDDGRNADHDRVERQGLERDRDQHDEAAVPAASSRGERGRATPEKKQEEAIGEGQQRPPFSAGDHDDWKFDRVREKAEARRSEYAERISERGGRSYKGIAVAVLVLLVLGGGGYAAWLHKDRLHELAAGFGRKSAPATPGNTVTPPAAGTNTASNNATANHPQGQQPPQGVQKMTQRLLPDGTEVDNGPAGGTPGIGEGKSTAAASPGGSAQANAGQPNANAGNAQPANPPATQPGAPQAAQAQQQAVPVGQQALLYEERGGAEQGSVEKGSVVWSVIQDGAGDGQTAQPAVRATVTMPSSKVSLKMTIRKNTDQSIPASHLIELVFTVPDNFPGGAIDNVQRITFKDTEQAPGNPLIAVPSKIGDNFFIIWLNDARTAQDTNLSLMRKLQWIDIPITYRNGRRALISLEKGVPGDKAFSEVLGDK